MININFKIKLSKKQNWLYSNLENDEKLKYLISFVSKNNYGGTYYDDNFSERQVENGITKQRLFNTYNHNDLKCTDQSYRKNKLKRMRLEAMQKVSLKTWKELL